MEMQRKTIGVILTAATMAFGAGHALAQATPCPNEEGKKGHCIEFKVRYYHYQSKKQIELLDSKDNVLKPCTLGKDCKPLGRQVDNTPLILMQFQSHLCYRKCYGDWCYDTCPAH